MKPDPEGTVHQGVSLKKSGRYLTPQEFKIVDYALGKFLGKRILPQLLDVDMELKSSMRGDDGGYKEVYTVNNPGLWGKQSCNEFTWRNEAVLRRIELEKDPDPSKRGPYRVCGNCSKGDDCATHIQIKANRKRQPEVPVEVEVGQIQ